MNKEIKEVKNGLNYHIAECNKKLEPYRNGNLHNKDLAIDDLLHIANDQLTVINGLSELVIGLLENKIGEIN